ncbi:hypothetical protein [Rhodopirellula halodulae]|uniref:hypothetical protein n=1 Tax=Rhodopirellula halodulae TaxID=2894198 RepID=UPI001E2D6DDF|nr:hypothetical protein [Rhodopirellula sp. JC737]MCC9655178.1 hypothetical protein [Rhodopirellula sp. JC737]
MNCLNWPMRRAALCVCAIGCLITFEVSPVVAQSAIGKRSSLTSPAEMAMQKSASGGRYLFVYFWKQTDENTRSMRAVFEEATGKMSGVADAISVRVSDPQEAEFVGRLGVDRAPMPLAIAIAPNGAVTRGLPLKFSEQQLRESIVSSGAASCLKAMQERKLILLCVKQPSATASFLGARELASDPRFSGSVQMVHVDPRDKSEQSFLQSLAVEPGKKPGEKNGVLVVMAPTGQTVATLTEGATREQIVAQLTKASAACCPGGQCEPGSVCTPGQACCPDGDCAPTNP